MCIMKLYGDTFLKQLLCAVPHCFNVLYSILPFKTPCCEVTRSHSEHNWGSTVVHTLNFMVMKASQFHIFFTPWYPQIYSLLVNVISNFLPCMKIVYIISFIKNEPWKEGLGRKSYWFLYPLIMHAESLVIWLKNEQINQWIKIIKKNHQWNLCYPTTKMFSNHWNIYIFKILLIMSSENNQLFQRRYMQANTKLDTAGKSFILLP